MMALPKKKKVRVWCPGGGQPIGACEKPDEGKEYLRTKVIRCLACGQRFEAQNVPTSCPDDIHRRVPKHKAHLTRSREMKFVTRKLR